MKERVQEAAKERRDAAVTAVDGLILEYWRRCPLRVLLTAPASSTSRCPSSSTASSTSPLPLLLHLPVVSLLYLLHRLLPSCSTYSTFLFTASATVYTSRYLPPPTLSPFSTSLTACCPSVPPSPLILPSPPSPPPPCLPPTPPRILLFRLFLI